MRYTSTNIQKQKIKGAFALLIYLGVILMFAFGASTPQKAENNDDAIIVELEGAIGQYPIQMTLNLKNIENNGKCGIVGEYRYTASGGGGMLELNGEKIGDKMILKEYNEKGELTGTFDGEFTMKGHLSSFEYTGTFCNSKGKTFGFNIKSI